MKSIGAKLFLTFLGLTSVVLIITMGLAKWGFEYGFMDYRRSLEKGRLEYMSSHVEQHFESNGGRWTDLTSVFFDQLVRDSFPDRKKGAKRRNHPPNRGGEPREEDRHDVGRPIFKDSQRRRKIGKEQMKPFGRGNGVGTRLRPKSSPELRAKTGLFDLSGEKIAGDISHVESEGLSRHTLMLNGKKIGELRALVEQSVVSPEERAFRNQQAWASGIITVLALLMAGISSWFLAKTLLSPIYRLKAAIGSLAKGNFDGDFQMQRKDELGELMTDVSRLSTTLSHNRESRRRWLADISHELRTPVTIISGEVEAMIDGLRPLDQTGLESLSHEVDRLKHLVDDLYRLSLSDVGGLRYEFSDLDLTALLNGIIESFRARVGQRGLSINFQAHKTSLISGDPQRLEQLFTNLIRNSMAYTDAPGIIELGIQQVGDRVVLTVSDSSPGVAEGNLRKLFNPLYREEESRNRRSGGAGLGLTICRNIVEAHNGKIHAESSSLGGVSIVINLPIA